MPIFVSPKLSINAQRGIPNRAWTRNDRKGGKRSSVIFRGSRQALSELPLDVECVRLSNFQIPDALMSTVSNLPRIHSADVFADLLWSNDKLRDTPRSKEAAKSAPRRPSKIIRHPSQSSHILFLLHSCTGLWQVLTTSFKGFRETEVPRFSSHRLV